MSHGNKILPPFAERYRLYIDESGDHVFKNLTQTDRRFLCLLCCFFRNSDYELLHNAFNQIKETHFETSVDEHIIFHREDMVNKRWPFGIFQNKEKRELFDADLVKSINDAKFKMFGIVVDKLALQENYSSPEHPYHLAMRFVLQRFCGFLKKEGAFGDVLAESRGGKEDMLLKKAYCLIFQNGMRDESAHFFQSTLSSGDLKVKQKIQNISGLQLCDMLGHPVRHHILLRHSKTTHPLSDFDKKIIGTLPNKYHTHVHNGKIKDSGHVLWPLSKK